MWIARGVAEREDAIVDLFVTSFTAAEGEDEGRLIGGLVRDLLADTPAADIHVFRAEENGQLIAAAVLTRLRFPEDGRLVVLLSPMAVTPRRQRQGVGRSLLVHALEALGSEGVEVAVTYGDPRYYGRIGFTHLTEEQARPPLPLSMPHGWLGRSLTPGPIPRLQGASICVAALNRADIW
jgi:putative acetyltransferase